MTRQYVRSTGSPSLNSPACPEWCDRLPRDHGTDEDFVVIGDPIHKHLLRDLGVHIFWSGSKEGLPPAIYVPALYDSHDNPEITDADTAEQLGRDIIEAARLLRSIQLSRDVASPRRDCEQECAASPAGG
jgi:hypothetical protein